MTEIIKNIEISSLVPFENHPFKEEADWNKKNFLKA